MPRPRPLVALALLLGATIGQAATAADQGKLDPRYPFRTDWANQQLAWYQPKPGEFPPHHSDHRVGGELIAADYIHRSGVFRMDGSGELVPFTMPPYASVYHLNAEADLRDVPLGTFFLFFLNQDENGAFTRLATMQDEFTMMANHGFSYRLAEIKVGEGRLAVVKQKLGDHPEDVGRNELLVDGRTRIRKGATPIALKDLAVGDALLVNLSGATAQHPRRCIDIWVGADTHQQVAEEQRKRHDAFLKQRGLPAWIDQADGRRLTVTLFSSEPASLRGLFKDEGIDPAQWAKEHRHIELVVANEHLRSYWPPVTKRGATIREFSAVPTDCYGCSGVRWVLETDAMPLEGFRAGRNLRLFVHPSWPIKDMPFGEGLHEGGHDIDEPPEAREVIAADFPYRTDFGNPQLPWYRLQPGRFPPEHSGHWVSGELLAVEADGRAGRFRPDHGEPVRFALPPCAAVSRLDADADLADLPLGTRCRFLLHPDAQGAFTQASVVMDECTWMSGNTATYRLEQTRLDEGRLFVAHQVEDVKVDYQLEPKHPPDFGRTELLVDATTRVWKGERRIALAELAAGDVLLVDLAGQGRCAELWVGAETRELLRGKQRAKRVDAIRRLGAPAWIDSVDGRLVTITFFAGDRAAFAQALGGDPWGKGVVATLADDALRAQGAPVRMGFSNHLPEGDTSGSYGCSGVRWVLDAAQLPDGWRPGRVVRVGKEDWPMAAAAGAK
jgi:hypothetical protein